jgi:protein gp37
VSVKRSTIGWTDFSGQDANFIIGCEAISAGCQNCYARVIVEQRGGRDFSQVRTFHAKLGRLGCAKFEPGDTPFRRGLGSRPMVFPCDLSDLFHKDVPTGFIQAAIGVMCDRSDVDWQLLTKRPWRMAHEIGLYLCNHGLTELPDHIWPGVTVESSIYRNRLHAPDCLPGIPSRRRFISVEPMLEPLVLRANDLVGISWVICGAESGPNRRPFETWWAEELYDTCRVAGVPFFGKQGSGLHPGTPLLINGQIVQEFPRD